MGGVPVKHHTRSKVGRRRSHHALKKQTLQVCASCNAPKKPHRACIHCGGTKTAATAQVTKPAATAKKKKQKI